jgi:hypothetical protein
MHRIIHTLRQIAAADLPTVTSLDGTTRTMTAGELLNVGIVHLHDDVYDCVEQHRSDDDEAAATGVRTWAPHGEPLPGTPISAGSHRERYARVPAEHAPKVFRAQVIRSADPAAPAATIVTANLTEVATAIAEYVGDVSGAPLVDLSGPAAVLKEAQRLVQIPDNGIDRHVVPMATVDPGDVVEADRIIPHRWHGESHR